MKTKQSEAAIRGQARRVGLRLVKSKVRNPDRVEFGTYALVEEVGGGLEFGESSGGRIRHGMSLEDCAGFIHKQGK